MTIENSFAKVKITGDGVTVGFPYAYPVLEPEHLLVKLVNNTTGVETVQVLDTNYTVTSTPSTSVTVIFNVAPTSTYSVVIDENIPPTQEIDLTEFGPFPAEVVEQALDKLTLICQQNRQGVNKSIKIDPPLVDFAGPYSITASAAERGDKVIGFSVDGTQLVLQDNPAGRADEAVAAAAQAVAAAAQAATDADDAEIAADIAVAAAGSVSGSDTSLQYVANHGWVGDGIYDDALAWNAARAALPADGGTVIGPSGDSYFFTSVTDNGKPTRFWGRGLGVSSDTSPTTIRGMADIEAFVLTSRGSEVRYLGGVGTGVTFAETVFGGGGTSANSFIRVGSSTANASHCKIIDVGVTDWGVGAKWEHGSFIEVDGFRAGQCPWGGFMADAKGNDAHHGQFGIVRIVNCGTKPGSAGASFGSTARGATDGTSNHNFDDFKVFGSGQIYFNASACTGHIMNEQTNSARWTMNVVSGQTTLTGLPDAAFYNLKVGARISGTGFAGQTWVRAFDSVAKTITLSDATTGNATNAFITAATLGSNNKVSTIYFGPLAKNNEGLINDGDNDDPRTMSFENALTNHIGLSPADDSYQYELESRSHFQRRIMRGANQLRFRPGCSFTGTFLTGNTVITNVPTSVFKNIPMTGYTRLGGRAVQSGTISVVNVDPAAQTITMSGTGAILTGDYEVNIEAYQYGNSRSLFVGTDADADVCGRDTDHTHWFGGSGAAYVGTITDGSAVITDMSKADTISSNGIASGFRIRSKWFPEGTTISSVTTSGGLITSVTMSAAAVLPGSDVAYPCETMFFFRPANNYYVGWMNELPTYADNVAASNVLERGILWKDVTGQVHTTVDPATDGVYEVVCVSPGPQAAGAVFTLYDSTTSATPGIDDNGKTMTNISGSDFKHLAFQGSYQAGIDYWLEIHVGNGFKIMGRNYSAGSLTPPVRRFICKFTKS